MGLDNPIHLALLLMILLLVFGAKRLPEMGRSLGGGLRGFKEAIGGESAPAGLSHDSTVSAQVDSAPAPTVVTATPVASTETAVPATQVVTEEELVH